MKKTEIEQYIFGSILLISNKMQVWGDNILSDLTLKQWFLLFLISKMEKTDPTINEIAQYSGTSRQNVKKMLEQLERKKYLRTKKSKVDARALNVILLKKTFDYFKENEQKAEEVVNQIFSEMTDEELIVTKQTFDKLHIFFGNPRLDGQKWKD